MLEHHALIRSIKVAWSKPWNKLLGRLHISPEVGRLWRIAGLAYLPIKLSACRRGSLETWISPPNGRLNSMIRPMAAETDKAQTSNVTTTVAFWVPSKPKLVNTTKSQITMTVMNTVDPELWDRANINQRVRAIWPATDRPSALKAACLGPFGLSSCNWRYSASPPPYVGLGRLAILLDHTWSTAWATMPRRASRASLVSGP